MAKTTERVITIESWVWKRKGYERIETGKEWWLWINGDTTLKDIEDFFDVAEHIYKDCMKAHKNGLEYKVQITQSIYHDDNTKKFDSWVSVPYTDQDGEGIYLKPDTRYTEAERDMYITKNVRKDLTTYVR